MKRNFLKPFYLICLLPLSISISGVTDADSLLQPAAADPVLSDSLAIRPIYDIPLPMGSISYADTVILYDPGALGENTGDEPEPKYCNAQTALGAPDYNKLTDSGYVSLGLGGNLVLKFTDNILVDGPGPDLFIFPADSADEEMLVWISTDGRIFIPVGSASQSDPAVDIRSSIKQTAQWRYVKIRDNTDGKASKNGSLGADIDAVAAISTAILLTLRSDRLFRGETIELLDSAEAPLKRAAETIRSREHVQVGIHVYTDSKGTDDFNFILSQERARVIRDFLINHTGLDHIQYTAIGRGKTRPLTNGNTASHHAMNGRVEIIIGSLPLME